MGSVAPGACSLVFWARARRHCGAMLADPTALCGPAAALAGHRLWVAGRRRLGLGERLLGGGFARNAACYARERTGLLSTHFGSFWRAMYCRLSAAGLLLLLHCRPGGCAGTGGAPYCPCLAG